MAGRIQSLHVVADIDACSIERLAFSRPLSMNLPKNRLQIARKYSLSLVEGRAVNGILITRDP